MGGYFVIQASLTHWQFPTPSPLTTLAGLISLLLINASVNNINAVFDDEIDKLNKPYRPIPSGVLRPSDALIAGIIMFWTAIVLAVFVNIVFFIFTLVLLAVTVVYSIPPVRVKRFLWLNNAHQAFARGVLGVLAAWSVYSAITLQALGLASILFLLIFAAQSSKDFCDVQGDTKFGIRTLPVVYGLDWTIQWMKKLMLLPFTGVVILVATGIFPITALAFLLLSPLAVFFLKSQLTASEKLENSRGWVLFYGLMVASLGIFSLVL